MESRTVVLAAIAANVAIAVIKFAAAIASGSAGLFSEGLHSVVDTGDGLLLLLGLYLSHRPATQRHPYGRGAETYFWSMVVAMSIFGIGGCLSIYEGIGHVMHPRMPDAVGWSFLVLAGAFVFESISWIISFRGFKHARGDRGVWEGIRRSKDPATFVVVLEDSAALIGITFAASGIALAHALDLPRLDAVASICIGVLLVVTGMVLGRETWSLLLGESASHEVVDSIQAIARAQPGVREAAAPRTMHLGPDRVHVDLELRLDDAISAVEVSRDIEDEVRAKHPEVRRVSFRFPL